MSRDPSDVTHFATPADFRSWLERHHEARDVLWVGYWKKATGRPSMTWEESVDVALCFGWIDGIRKSLNEEAYTIRFTPRRGRSIWSRRNVERYAAMLEEGHVRPSGAEAFAARVEEKTGVYSFEQPTTPELSKAFQERLRANRSAWEDWEGRPPGYRRQAAHWVMSAKREETRERRFAALVADCQKGRKIRPLR